MPRMVDPVGWRRRSSSPLPALDRATVVRLNAPDANPLLRAVAAAWLRAYDAARAEGLDERVARHRAAAAWDRCRAELLAASAGQDGDGGA